MLNEAYKVYWYKVQTLIEGCILKIIDWILGGQAGFRVKFGSSVELEERAAINQAWSLF